MVLEDMMLPVISYLALSLRLSLGIVFLLSALPKLYRPRDFAANVIDYHILPAKVAFLFALLLIPLEAFLTFAFITGWFLNVAFPLSLLLLIIFLTAVAINLRRGRQIACGCFGTEGEKISYQTVARLLLLLAGSLMLISYSASTKTQMQGFPVEGSGITDLLHTMMLAIFITLLGTWLLHLPELVGLVRYQG